MGAGDVWRAAAIDRPHRAAATRTFPSIVTRFASVSIVAVTLLSIWKLELVVKNALPENCKVLLPVNSMQVVGLVRPTPFTAYDAIPPEGPRFSVPALI